MVNEVTFLITVLLFNNVTSIPVVSMTLLAKKRRLTGLGTSCMRTANCLLKGAIEGNLRGNTDTTEI